MPNVMADHNVEGHLQALVNLWSSADWADAWAATGCEVGSFERLGLPPNASDEKLWLVCQENDTVLVTGNRNSEGEGSLESTIRRRNTPHSLPVVTIGDPDRLLRDRGYLERVAAQLLEYLLDLDELRGTGRLYVP
jgi:hypothetical protein